MVVVPTEQNVELVFERDVVDWLAIALTGLGIVASILLAGPALRRRPEEPRHQDEVIIADRFDEHETEPDDNRSVGEPVVVGTPTLAGSGD